MAQMHACLRHAQARPLLEHVEPAPIFCMNTPWSLSEIDRKVKRSGHQHRSSSFGEPSYTSNTMETMGQARHRWGLEEEVEVRSAGQKDPSTPGCAGPMLSYRLPARQFSLFTEYDL